MQNGGARQGAGRKKGQVARHTLQAQTIRQKLVDAVDKNVQPLLTAKLDLALGHYVEETQKDGTTRVYFKSPDNNSIQYLFNQSIGKPKESVDVTSGGETIAGLIAKLDD